MIRLIQRLFILFIVLIVIIWLLLKIEAVQEKGRKVIENQLFTATGLHLEMSHISLGFSGILVINEGLIKDEEGLILFHANSISLSLDFSPVLKGKFPNIKIKANQAHIYSIPSQWIPPIETPPLDANSSNIQLPDITFKANDLELDSQVFEQLKRSYNKSHLFIPLRLNSVHLEKLMIRSFNGQFEILGETAIEADIEEKPLHLQAAFHFGKDQSFNAHFDALYNQTLPFHGKLALSSSLNLDGSKIYTSIPFTKLFKALEDDVDSYPKMVDQTSVEETIEGVCTLSGPLISPRCDLLLTFDTLAYQLLELKNTSIHFCCNINDREIVGESKASSIVNGERLSLAAEFNHRYGSSTVLSLLEIIGDSGTLKASLNFSATDHWIEGKAEGQIKDLSRFNFSLKAPLHYQVTFPGLNQLAQAIIFIPMLSFEEGSLNEMVLEVSIDNLLTSPIANLHLTTKNALYHGLELVKAEMTTSVSLKEMIHPFTFNGETINQFSPFIIEAKGGWNRLEDGWKVNFESLSGNAFALPFILSDSIVLAKENSIYSLSPFLFSFGDTHLEGSLAYSELEDNLEGNFALVGEITPLLQHFLNKPPSFSGSFQAGLHLNGSYAAPQITARASISNGTYEVSEIGVSLKNLIASIELLGTELKIIRIEAEDGKGGLVAGSGSFIIDKENHHPFSIQLNLKEATLLNQDYIQVVCNGPLVFSGNINEGMLTGQLEASQGSVQIPERSSTIINTVDVLYVNTPKDIPKPSIN